MVNMQESGHHQACQMVHVVRAADIPWSIGLHFQEGVLMVGAVLQICQIFSSRGRKGRKNLMSVLGEEKPT